MGARASVLNLVQTQGEEQLENLLLNEDASLVDWAERDADGRTALHWAALLGSSYILNYFIDFTFDFLIPSPGDCLLSSDPPRPSSPLPLPLPVISFF